MAGSPVSQTGKGAFNNNYVLLDGATTTTNSIWYPVGQARHFTFYASGIVTNDIVTLHGFVDDGTGEPAARSHGEAITTITADGLSAQTVRPDFIKARLTATAGGGTVTVICKAGW